MGQAQPILPPYTLLGTPHRRPSAHHHQLRRPLPPPHQRKSRRGIETTEYITINYYCPIKNRFFGIVAYQTYLQVILDDQVLLRTQQEVNRVKKQPPRLTPPIVVR